MNWESRKATSKESRLILGISAQILIYVKLITLTFSFIIFDISVNLKKLFPNWCYKCSPIFFNI
jgi:hypothetical protein